MGLTAKPWVFPRGFDGFCPTASQIQEEHPEPHLANARPAAGLLSLLVNSVDSWALEAVFNVKDQESRELTRGETGFPAGNHKDSRH